MASRTKDVTRSRQKAQEAGRQRLSAMLSADGSDAYRRLRERYGGSERDLIEAALAALERRNELTKVELLAEIERRLK